MADANDELVNAMEGFGVVARVLANCPNEQAVLDRLVQLAVEHLDACEFAAITLVRIRVLASPASSGDIPKTLDRIQSEVGEGPCIDAIAEHEVFQTGDLAGEERWPQFATRAHDETGVASILSLRLFVEGNTMGALNLYSTRPDAFDDIDVAICSVFAAYAAIAMSSAEREHDLELMAANRDIIGRAKGILMARERVTDDQAFEMLRRASQRLNIKVVTIAEQLNARADADARGDPPAP